MNILFVLLNFVMVANSMSTISETSTVATATVPLSIIRTGQLGAGYKYAFYKAQLKAKLNPEQDWQTFSKKEYKTLLDDVTDEVNEGVPVFIAPNGNMHAVDQHHDMFVLCTIAPEMHPVVPVNVLHDFSKEVISEKDFKKTVLDKGWVYTSDIDAVLDTPLTVKELKDFPERSVVGMAFLGFEEGDVPLKGKHFIPFIQFLLIDFLKEQQLMTFDKKFNPKDVEKLAELLQTSADVKAFLRDRLNEKPPEKLKEFLK